MNINLLLKKTMLGIRTSYRTESLLRPLWAVKKAQEKKMDVAELSMLKRRAVQNKERHRLEGLKKRENYTRKSMKL